MAYIIGIIVVVLVAVGFALMKSEDAPEPTMAQEETNSPEASTDILVAGDTEVNTEVVSASTIPDGAHTTSVTYLTPANNEYLLNVTLTTNNGVITDANIVYSQGAEVDPNAQRFEGAYKEAIIGKQIDELDLSRVGGASLTTGAFNRAIE
ncbi:hypothetical protein KC906_04080, partial [Candidatus Kaiserbacteria bacterium]|nr:hypothetical protein [Candidatus Kaiserbacteria bacterium]